MTMPAIGGSPHARGLLFAAGAAVIGIVVSGVAGWLGFLIFFAGYLTTWFISVAYQRAAGPPTRKNLPGLLGLIAVAILAAFLASEFGWFLKQALDAGLGGNLIAYFWTIMTDPDRWAGYLWWRSLLFVVFSALGAVRLLRALGPTETEALNRELARRPDGQYQPPAGSAWNRPAQTPAMQPPPGPPVGTQPPPGPGAGTFFDPSRGEGLGIPPGQRADFSADEPEQRA